MEYAEYWEYAYWIIAAWVIFSAPVSFIAGRFIAAQDRDTWED